MSGPEAGEIEERWAIRRSGIGCACTDEDGELCEDDGPGFGNAGESGCTCHCHIGPVWDPAGDED